MQTETASSGNNTSDDTTTAQKQIEDIARPDKFGRYGRFGGQYVPETLMAALAELESVYTEVDYSSSNDIDLRETSILSCHRS